MANTFEYTGINTSSTVAIIAGMNIKDAQCKAVKFADGKAILPAAGEMPIGILLVSEDEIPIGGETTVQIKDIGLWKAGAAIDAGDMLATDSEGFCQKATAGQYIFARALNSAAAKGDLLKVQIVNAGYAKAAEGGN